MDAPSSAFEVAQLKKQIMNLKKENFELRAMVRQPLLQHGGKNDLTQETTYPTPTAIEENIAALRASYEAKLAFLHEEVSVLKKNAGNGGGLAFQAENRTTGLGLSRTLREKYETKIRDLSRELSAARLAATRASTTISSTSSAALAMKESQEVQLLSHQLTTLRSTLQSTRVEKNRIHQQLTEEMTRLRTAFEQRENELRQLRMAEREHKEEINRLRRSLEHTKCILRKKSSTITSSGSSLCNGPLMMRSTPHSSIPKVSSYPRGLWSSRSGGGGGKELFRENPPLLPILSPETLHKRSAFIIAPSSPIIAAKKTNFLEEELKVEDEEIIPMDVSNEELSMKNTEAGERISNLSKGEFAVVKSSPPSYDDHHNCILPSFSTERREPISVSSLFNRISAFATSSRRS